MDVVLAFKWERDPDDAFVSSDGSVKWYMEKLKASDDDAAAIACARKLAADAGGQLRAVTIGDGDVGWALARGAASAVSVGEYGPSDDEAVTARCLANAIAAAGEADVVVMGDAQAHAGVAGVVGALLGLTVVTGVREIVLDADAPECVLVSRATSEAEETLRVRMPALVAVAAADAEKSTPTMKQILAAKKLPVDRREAADVGEVSGGHVHVASTSAPAARRARMIEGTPIQAAGELVATLVAEGVLEIRS